MTRRTQWPQTRKQPDTIMVWVERPGANPVLMPTQVQPHGGEPGRPFKRMLKRALAEEAARRTRKPAVKVIVGTLPKATKQDRGSLAGLKERGFQRLGRPIHKHGLILTPHRHASAA